jgi:acyl-coenzyme A thioesterase PaaI-like protein
LIESEKCSKQLAVTVETNVSYHSSQKMTDQFIAENVFKSTNHKNVVVPGLTEMIEVPGLTEMIEVLGLIEVQGITDVEKCSKQLAVTVETNVKYHSSQKMTDQFIAENVFKVIEKIENKINFYRAKLIS